jgi:hypothetical protein
MEQNLPSLHGICGAHGGEKEVDMNPRHHSITVTVSGCEAAGYRGCSKRVASAIEGIFEKRRAMDIHSRQYSESIQCYYGSVMMGGKQNVASEVSCTCATLSQVGQNTLCYHGQDTQKPIEEMHF